MAKKNKNSAQKRKQSAGNRRPATPVESSVSEALTVFWTVSVAMCLTANLMAIFAHFYVVANPAAEKMALLKGLVLFAGAVIGVVSLLVLPLLYRLRQVPPPPGLATFGACVAAAPILALWA